MMARLARAGQMIVRLDYRVPCRAVARDALCFSQTARRLIQEILDEVKMFIQIPSRLACPNGHITIHPAQLRRLRYPRRTKTLTIFKEIIKNNSCYKAVPVPSRLQASIFFARPTKITSTTQPPSTPRFARMAAISIACRKERHRECAVPPRSMAKTALAKG